MKFLIGLLLFLIVIWIISKGYYSTDIKEDKKYAKDVEE